MYSSFTVVILFVLKDKLFMTLRNLYVGEGRLGSVGREEEQKGNIVSLSHSPSRFLYVIPCLRCLHRVLRARAPMMRAL